MKIIIKIKTILVVALAVVLSNCSDNFLDVNDSPNNPTVSTPSLTLPVAQQYFTALNARQMNYLGNFMMYNWAVPSNWSSQEDLIRYNITTATYATIFETSYSSIFKNLNYIESYEDGVQDYSTYKVIAKTLRSFQYQYLVDLYGDVPFSEANLRADNPTPKYDDAETVYKAVIDQLTAAALLAVNIPDIHADPESQDIIFGGDVAKWAQFANTIKLRMLVRLSNTGQDSYITAEIAKIDANGAGYITETVWANPGYSDDANKQNPFYNYLGKKAGNTSFNDRWDYTVASDYAVDKLIVTNDDRYKRLYSEASKGGYHGVEQSTALPGEGFTSKDLSHVGPGLIIKSEQDQPIMLISEAKLIQAEAIIRGYISGGDAAAKGLYEAAIEDSYVYLKVGKDDATSIQDAQDYYAQNVNNIAWDSSTDKIEAIITQKSIALNGTCAIEAWIEYTRTGYPTGIPIPEESDGVRPVRLLYPASEIARNSDNVPNLAKTDVFTKNPFWK